MCSQIMTSRFRQHSCLDIPNQTCRPRAPVLDQPVNGASNHQQFRLWRPNAIACHAYTTFLNEDMYSNAGLILGLRSAHERRRYFVTTSLIGWAQSWNHERRCYFVTTSLIGWAQSWNHETALLCNDVSLWLGTSLESALVNGLTTGASGLENI